MNPIKVVHLVDDTTAGGVMRNLEFLMQHPGLAGCFVQSVRRVQRGSLAIGRIEADVIVSHLTISWRGLPGLIALRAMNAAARLVHVEHSYTRAFTALNVTQKSRFFALLRVAYSLFDTVVSVSQAQADWIKERELVDARALRVIHPEVDLTHLSNLRAPTGRPRVIGAIGRLDRQKGFDILIEAFRQCSVPDARLLIFGDGNEREHLEAMATGDSRIEFRGHVTDPMDAYGAVDLVAVPSRWEAFGLVAREARAASRPVLLAPVDGLNDQIQGPQEVVGYCDAKLWASVLENALTGKSAPAVPVDRPKTQNGNGFMEKWCDVMRSAPT